MVRTMLVRLPAIVWLGRDLSTQLMRELIKGMLARFVHERIKAHAKVLHSHTNLNEQLIRELTKHHVNTSFTHNIRMHAAKSNLGRHWPRNTWKLPRLAQVSRRRWRCSAPWNRPSTNSNSR